MFTDKKIYVVALIKLIAIPLIMIAGFKLLNVPKELAMAISVSASAPCANNTVILAGKYGLDTGVASKTVALVSFFSIITMPVMIALAAT